MFATCGLAIDLGLLPMGPSYAGVQRGLGSAQPSLRPFEDLPFAFDRIARCLNLIIEVFPNQPTALMDGYLPCVEPSLPLIRKRIPLVRDPITFVRDTLPLVRNPVAPIRRAIALVSDSVALGLSVVQRVLRARQIGRFDRHAWTPAADPPVR